MEDVIIVGAGPAGCSLANLLSKAGFKVLVFDSLPDETTRFCGEWVNTKDVEDCLQIKIEKKLLLNKYKEARLIFVDTGKALPIPIKNICLVDTTLLKKILRKKAESQGAKFIFKKRITGVIKKNNAVVGVKAGGKKYFSKIVAGCDGPESFIARSAGFNCSKNKATPGFRWRFKNCKNLDVKSANFYFFEKLGIGYIWLYPINKTKCNVGIGAMDPTHMHEVYDDFVKNEPLLKNAKIYYKGVGKATYTGILPKISCPGCVLVGEAAGQVHSLVGGGINPAFFAAKIAAKAMITALENNSYATGGLRKYDILYKKSRDGRVIKKSTKRLLNTIKLHKRKNIITMLNQLVEIVPPKIIKKGSVGNLTPVDILRVFLKHPIKLTKIVIDSIT